MNVGEDLDRHRAALSLNLHALALITLDAPTMNGAARITEKALCRPLDSIRLAAVL